MRMYERLKRMCKDRGITISALERELGFSRGSLSKIDKNKPGADRLQKLANYFGVPVDAFYHNQVQNFGHQKEYYEDPELLRMAQEMFEDRDMRMLFDMKKNMDPDRFAIQMRAFRDMYRLEHPEEFPEDHYD